VVFLLPRQHLPQDDPDRFRPVFVSRTLERIRPLEGVRPDDLHLPAVIRLGADDRNPPISSPIGKHMLNHRRNFPWLGGITRVLHLH
jgi:hypothetical protein